MTADALRPDALPPEPTLAERWQRGIADLRYLVEHEHSHIRWIVAAYRMRQLAAILAAADITGDDYVRAEHAALLVIRALTPGQGRSGRVTSLPDTMNA